MVPPTDFGRFARVCGALQREPSRLRKMQVIADFLREVDDAERPWAARFLIGHPLPETESKQLHVGGAQIFGLAHTSRESLGREPVTLRELGERFAEIANIHGNGSVRRREQILANLYHRIAPGDREWFVRILAGEMRHGVSEGVVLEASARAMDCEPDLVRRAHMLRGDTGEAVALAFRGCDALRDVSLRLFHPMRVMLADTALEPGQAIRAHGGRTAFEYKFDGARVIVHKRGDEIRVYSRRLNEVTLSVPEVVEQMAEVQAKECVVEGEAVGVGPNGATLPFQDLMRRFRRVNELAAVRKQVGIRLYLFDALHQEGKTLLDRPYEQRWQALVSMAPARLLAPRLVTDSAEQAEAFFRRALRDGHEGVVAKRLESPYVPGRRGANWLKIKQAKTLDVVILGAEWGTGRRARWLSNYHLGVRVPAEDEALLRAPVRQLRAPASSVEHYAMVGKTFKGPTDDEFEEMTKRLLLAAERTEAWGVVLPPRFVAEVEYNDLQESPHYPGRYALRFARIRRFREDKSPREVDTLGTLHRLAALERARVSDHPEAAAPGVEA